MLAEQRYKILFIQYVKEHLILTFYTTSFDMGVKIAYDFKLYKTVDLQLSGGVQNIFEAYQKDFDRGANRDSNYIYGPSLPRSFFAGVKISY